MEEELTGIIWKTAEGKENDLANLSNQHLVNIFFYLLSRYPFRKEILPDVRYELNLRDLLSSCRRFLEIKGEQHEKRIWDASRYRMENML